MQLFQDELLWAAAWLHEASGDLSYMEYLINNAGTLGGTEWATTEFSWDVKYAGVQVLVSKVGYETNVLLSICSVYDYQ